MPKEASETGSKRRRLSVLLTPFRKASTMIGRVIGRTPWLRRRYAWFLLRSVKKQRAKGRTLPDGLLRMERQVRGLPRHKQVEVIEQLLEAGATWKPEEMGRAMRRAGAKQERQSGKGHGARPGLMPGQRRRV